MPSTARCWGRSATVAIEMTPTWPDDRLGDGTVYRRRPRSLISRIKNPLPIRCGRSEPRRWSPVAGGDEVSDSAKRLQSTLAGVVVPHSWHCIRRAQIVRRVDLPIWTKSICAGSKPFLTKKVWGDPKKASSQTCISTAVWTRNCLEEQFRELLQAKQDAA